MAILYAKKRFYRLRKGSPSACSLISRLYATLEEDFLWEKCR
jgi:hypothetical protein